MSFYENKNGIGIVVGKITETVLTPDKAVITITSSEYNRAIQKREPVANVITFTGKPLQGITEKFKAKTLQKGDFAACKVKKDENGSLIGGKAVGIGEYLTINGSKGNAMAVYVGKAGTKYLEVKDNRASISIKTQHQGENIWLSVGFFNSEYGKLADRAEHVIKDGNIVAVLGTPPTEYENRKGETRYSCFGNRFEVLHSTVQSTSGGGEKKNDSQKVKAPDIDPDFDEFDGTPAAAVPKKNVAPAPTPSNGGEDSDFDEFEELLGDEDLPF